MNCEYCGKPQHAHICREHGNYVTQHAVADPKRLHESLLFALTTNPARNEMFIVLMWEQREPWKWTGYHPEVCVEVGSVMGYTTEA